MKKILLCSYQSCFAFLLFSFLCPKAKAQCLPNFGAAARFALFTANGAVDNMAHSTIIGDIGTNLGVVSGFESPTTVTGTIHVSDSVTSRAATDLLAAFQQLNNIPATNVIHPPAYGAGETLTSGVYASAALGSVGGVLILDGLGDANAVFIFKFGGAFTVGAGSSIILVNGASATNIFWVVNGAISLAADSSIRGTLIANNGAVSMGQGGSLQGRMYSTTGAIATYGNVIDVSGTTDSSAEGGMVTPNQTICSASPPANLLLSGYTGNIIKWQKSTDAAFAVYTDISNTSANLTGEIIGNLTETTYFRAVVETNNCNLVTDIANAATITILGSTTWGAGGWSNGIPVSGMSAIIAAPFTTTSDFNACSLRVTSGVQMIVSSGNSVRLYGALIVDPGSSFTLNDGANFIQTSNVSNTGTIVVKKVTSTLMRQDYVMWSSPVGGQNLQSFSPATLANRFYKYDALSDIYENIISPSTTSFSAGSSYLIRMPNNHPSTPTIWNATFSGIPSNGNINLQVMPNTFNAVGNPYPSNIDADAFMALNNITEALYFWRKTNNANNSSYACYTAAGGVSNSGGDPLGMAPDRTVSIGQGFLVKSAASNTLSFTNAMRVQTPTSTLLRSTLEKSRIWLNLTDSNGFFGQTLVAYMPNATAAIDAAIDGRFFGDSQTAFTSMIGNEEFAIQGRSLPFDADSTVAMGFKSQLAQTYTISIDHVDGLFLNGQVVYLKDNVTNTTQNLSENPYTFATEAGTFNGRFEIVYQNSLHTAAPAWGGDTVVVYKQNQDVVIHSGATTMKEIRIYDIRGRLLVEKKNIGVAEIKINIGTTPELLIVKITSDANETITKKVIQ